MYVIQYLNYSYITYKHTYTHIPTYKHAYPHIYTYNIHINKQSHVHMHISY